MSTTNTFQLNDAERPISLAKPSCSLGSLMDLARQLDHRADLDLSFGRHASAERLSQEAAQMRERGV